MSSFADPVLIGAVISAVGGVAIAYFGLKRSKKTDEKTDAQVAIGQIIDGLQRLADSYQADNRDLRNRLSALQASFDTGITERNELRRRIVELGGMVCLIAFLMLGVTSVKHDQERLVTRAAAVARTEAAADTQQEVEARVDDKVEALGITTTTFGPPAPTSPTTAPASLPTTVPTVPSTTTTTTTEPPIVTLPTVPPTTLPTVPVTLP